MCRRYLFKASLLLALLGAQAHAGEPSDAYKLGPQDKLRIAVHEWRPAINQVYDWAALAGEYTVDSAGMISLPLLGQMDAESLTTGDLAAAIAESLQRKVGLVQRPDASVQIIQFRPFYILGGVAKPGDYPYRPGLTVLQAVSIAGGLHRISDPGDLRLDREAISSDGDLRIMAAERNALLARQSRLQAELDNSNSIVFPQELQQRKGDAQVAQLLKQEDLLFQSRREAQRSEIQSLNQIETLLQKEVVSLKAKEVSQDRQLVLAKKELDNVSSLLSKGLAVSARQISTEQDLAQLQAGRLDLDLSILRAQQEISKTDRDALDLNNKRQAEVISELSDTQEKLEELAQKLITTSQLESETATTGAEVESERSRAKVAQSTYVIIRKSGSEQQELASTESTAVQPGDVIKVNRGALQVGGEQGPDLTTSPTAANAPSGQGTVLSADTRALAHIAPSSE